MKRTLAFLICLCFVTSAHAGDTKPFQLTAQQVSLLTERILANTPEHIHFAKGSHFSWVLLSWEVQLNPAPLREAVIKQLKKRYTVYSDSNLPDHLVIRDNQGALAGYRDGFEFSFTMSPRMDGTVMVSYSDWEGDLASSSHWERYQWTGNEWKVMEKSPTLVS